MKRLTLARPPVIEKPVVPHYMPQTPALVGVVLCLAHCIRSVEFSISPDGRLRLWVKTAAYLWAVGSMVLLLATGALYAALFLAGIALAVAGLILGAAEALLGAVVALLAAWLVGKVLGRLIAEDWKKRTHRP